MFVGSFEPDDFNGFQSDVVATITAFKAAGVSRLLIDLTNNGGQPHFQCMLSHLITGTGGFVCLGQFLHQYLAGAKIGNPGFVSTNRASPLAQKIVAADIALGLDGSLTFYTADNC